MSLLIRRNITIFMKSTPNIKLKTNNDLEVVIRQITIEGLLSIQAGENPRIIEEKLKSFLAPGARDNLTEGGEG